MKDWTKIAVSPTMPLMKAIQVLDESSMQILLVIDDHNQLLGTVTDGDVRRGILKKISLDNPIAQIMNPKPTVAQLNDGREHILAVMRMKKFRHIPVVDNNNCLVGIEVLDELLLHPKLDNPVVLLAGGKGNRLRPLTNDCPKPMLKVGNKPILETILDNFIEYGFHYFYLSVNYKAEMIKEYFKDGSRWGVNIRYLHENEPMGTAGPLGLLPETPGMPMIVMNGDLLTKVNFRQLLDFHHDHKAHATMCVRAYDSQIPYGVVKIDKGRLIDIEEKPMQQFFVSAGIYVLEPDALHLIPKNKHYDMPDLFKKIVHAELETSIFPIREYWIDIGRLDEFERANGEYSQVFE